jgi:aldehyde dehydrogenase
MVQAYLTGFTDSLGKCQCVDGHTVTHYLHEHLGVVGQVIPWNFPRLIAAWKLAPALAAGNYVVLKPTEQTPVSVLTMLELIQDILPAGVPNVANGHGKKAGEALATSKRIA